MFEVAKRFSVANRRSKGEFIRQYCRDNGLRSMLFIGAGGGTGPIARIVEQAAAAEATTVVSADLIVHRDSPWTFVQCDGTALPFPDQSFDLVLSNAVIEHVGDEDLQRRFVAEHLRVGRHFAVTTPNKWFPVETHTQAVLRHWSPRWRAAHADRFTRLLSKRQLKALLPAGSRIRADLLRVTWTGVGRSEGSRA